MDDPYSVRVPATCDCGHQFDIPLVGKDPETMEFTCPGCGKVDRFTPEQAASIIEQYETAKAVLRDKVVKLQKDLFKRR